MPPPDPKNPAGTAEAPGAPAGEPAAGDGTARARFPIVGIGASAGGLEALESLTRRLAPDGMAFVVLQHLAPGHVSMLTEILQRGTSMKVATVSDGVRVEPRTIYVTPPASDVTLSDGVLHLARAADRVPRQSIDAFLRTLAADLGPMSIGVILSGAGTDGTLGLRAIKEEGGITFVQQPSTASQGSMPQSAIDAGCADFCLSPAEIGDELMRLSSHPYVARKRPEDMFDPKTLRSIFGLLHRAFGVDFSAYKMGTVERRIERRMALQKLDRFEDYLKLLESNPDELNILYSDLLVGVTGFFRDREPFEALRTVVFPRLVENRKAETPIRIWVPGCSTGEEAYTIAISLLEFLESLPGGPAGFKVQIFGTDIDDHALARARTAHYPQSIELDISAARLQRFFSRYNKGYQISRQIRDMVVFARHNLGKDPPFSRLDLVSCRNVLIYMQPPLQRTVLRVFHYALSPDGFLMLGTSESVGEASELFSLVDRRLKIYTRKNSPSTGPFEFSFAARQLGSEQKVQEPTPPTERRPLVSIQQLADRRVLDKFGPPGVLVDENLDVIQFRGQAGPYLGPSPGVATLNVMKLVRHEILGELRATLQKAAAEALPQISKPVPIRRGDGQVEVVIDVTPLQETSARRRCFLILFREPASEETVAIERAQAEERSPEPRVQELERELLVTRESLQTTVEELEAANEELQSSNEELQSSNEELQSTNEELETSKEELQSTNEELATVNEELQNRMTQLSVSNDDLQNVMSNVSVPWVIVGMDLRIRRFSAQAEKLLNLIPGDVGRPIGYLGASLNAPQIESVVSDAINSVQERTQRVRSSNGHWYTARLIPYRTADHSIRGAILEFLRAPVLRRAGEAPEIPEFAGKVLATLPNVLVLLDEQLRLIWANRSFFETFFMGAEVLGRTLDEVWPGRSSDPELWRALEETSAGGSPFSDVWVSHPFGRNVDRPMKVSGRCIAAEGDRPALTLVQMVEPSEGRPR